MYTLIAVGVLVWAAFVSGFCIGAFFGGGD
ncbi:MAG: hypothetical protein JWN99_2555 [Ilumatobacteraceae bacterium]|nr:hypothetical protein [Ilumatobacteraceae bacterium]